ncbi:hypothetical protein ACSYGO_07605 [Streptomyces krungchingensis]
MRVIAAIDERTNIVQHDAFLPALFYEDLHPGTDLTGQPTGA